VDPPADQAAAPSPPGSTLLLHLDGSLYTGNAQVTQDAVITAARTADPPPTTVVLDGSAVHRVTVPLVDALRSMHETLAGDGAALLLAEFPRPTLDALRRSRWFTEFEASGAVWPTVDSAVDSATEPNG
jgi:MFS superfamily sulfate permease-like transporter